MLLDLSLCLSLLFVRNPYRWMFHAVRQCHRVVRKYTTLFMIELLYCDSASLIPPVPNKRHSFTQAEHHSQLLSKQLPGT